MAGNKKKVVQFWGREFDIVNQGLCQSQVYAFINELINENEILAEKTERLALMERLAGETLFEADRLAMSIENNAQQEATHILQSFEEEAAKIKANIREEVKQLLVETREKLTSEMKQNGDKIHRRILGRLEQAMTDV